MHQATQPESRAANGGEPAIDEIVNAASGSEPKSLIAALSRLPWRSLTTAQLIRLSDALYPRRDCLEGRFSCLEEFWCDSDREGMPEDFYANLARPATPAPLAPKPMLAELLQFDPGTIMPMAAADPVAEFATIAVWTTGRGYSMPPAHVRVVAPPRLEAVNCGLEIRASFEFEQDMPEPVRVAGIFVVEYGDDPQNRKVLYRTEIESVAFGNNIDFHFTLDDYENPRLKGYYLYVPPEEVTMRPVTLHPGG
jgi:hypothetical protein